jgi:hypothetical protein
MNKSLYQIILRKHENGTVECHRGVTGVILREINRTRKANTDLCPMKQ